MRMQLNLVSFEQATALKNLGFPALSADWSYRNDGELYNFVDDDGYVTAAPTLELAAKWFREEKEIIFCPTIVMFYDEVQYSINEIYNGTGRCIGVCGHKLYNTYEQALSAGVDKAIEILKNK